MSYLLLTINQCEVKIKSFLELNRVPRTSLKKPTPNFAICTFLKLLQNDFFYFKPVSRYQMSTCSIVRWRSDFYKMYQMTCRPINICYNRVEWHISRKIQKNPFPFDILLNSIYWDPNVDSLQKLKYSTIQKISFFKSYRKFYNLRKSVKIKYITSPILRKKFKICWCGMLIILKKRYKIICQLLQIFASLLQDTY